MKYFLINCFYKNTVILKFIFLIICFFEINIYQGISSDFDDDLKHPVHILKNYKINFSNELIERIESVPEHVIKYLKELDEREDYENYVPADTELEIVKKSLKILPEKFHKILSEKLIGIYFIKNFMGSGYTEWVSDENKKIFFFMVLNPEVLSGNLSEALTYKENTCFEKDNSSIKLKIDCGKNYPGLCYILIHESAHVFDYIEQITPFVEPAVSELSKADSAVHIFSTYYWQSYKIPFMKYDFELRNNISFYGLSGHPKLKISDAENIYEQLAGSPFVSLYGSKNWAEDFAEMVSFYLITEKFMQPYIIEIYDNNKIIKRFEPVKNKIVKNRFKLIAEIFNLE